MAVALYARVSTVRQAEQDLSIPDQLQQMRAWCQAQGYGIAQEYIEPCASATDDKRPEFQRMIADATLAPAPYEAIIVHSLSRFFRDALEFGLYERRLHKAGVRLISITQQTSDDPSGEMARKIFSLFDEYQSKENGKHTLRAMKENAQQGFWNGSRPPFGYRTQATERLGNKGKPKQVLVIDDAEAAIVRQIYALYQFGLNGHPLGIKAIADHLNRQGLTLRGRPWRNQKIHKILSDTVYIGEAYFNRTNCKQQTRKPPEEWIMIPVPAMIDREAFAAVSEMRSARAPAKTPPRQVTTPTLLTGLLKCGDCGAGMTLTKGKSGRYQYYKCTTKHSKSVALCHSPNLPMRKLDELVLNRLADQVFTPERVGYMLEDLRQHIQRSKSDEDRQLAALKRELQTVETGQERLYQGIEQGILPIDDSLSQRLQKLKAQRENLLTAMAGLRRKQSMPLDKITPKRIQAFTQALKTRLMDRASGFGKQYLRLLVDEIRIDGNRAEMRGSYAALAAVMAQAGPDKSRAPQCPDSCRIGVPCGWLLRADDMAMAGLPGWIRLRMASHGSVQRPALSPCRENSPYHAPRPGLAPPSAIC